MITTTSGLGISWKDIGKGAAGVVKQAAVDTGKTYTTSVTKRATAGVSSLSTVQKAAAYKKAADAYLDTNAPAAAGSPIQKNAAKRLQAALATLGKIAKSAKLMAVKVDGAIGTATLAAVNWAFTKHIGPGQALAQYRTGKMPLAYVRANANPLAEVVEAEIARRGGTPAAPSLVAKAAAVKAMTTAPTAVSANPKASAKRLQAAMLLLGKIAGSPSLSTIKVDGAIGPKSVAAVNLVFTKHLGPGQAPAALRTGALTLSYIKSNADTLATFVENESKRRGGAAAIKSQLVAKASVKATGAKQRVTTKTGKQVVAQKVSTAAGETYEVEDPATGHTYYTKDPTVAPPPVPPDEMPEASDDQAATAAHASAASAGAGVVAPEQIGPGSGMPSDAGESFFSKYKVPLLGGLAAALVGGAVLIAKSKKGQTQRIGRRATA